MRVPVLACLVLLVLAEPCVAQQAQQQAAGDTIPSSIFYWAMGIFAAIVSGLSTALKILWTRLQEEQSDRIEDQKNYQAQDRATLKTGMETFQSATTALNENTREIKALRQSLLEEE